MANNDSIQKTITVAVLLCVVCSVIVSAAAVILRPTQVVNKALNFKSNILSAAGIYNPDISVDEQFKSVTIRVVDLQTGKFTDDITDVEKYDQFKAAKDPAQSNKLDKSMDIALVRSMEHYSKVYLASTPEGKEILVMPVRGYGLWGTLFGFIALESDLNTIAGLGFYEHQETPGLGGEVDNPKWKSSIVGKKLYSASGDLEIEVIKGIVTPTTANSQYKIDGLSGATLTSKGVSNLLQFWLGENGYGPFLSHFKNGEA